MISHVVVNILYIQQYFFKKVYNNIFDKRKKKYLSETKETVHF